MADKRQAGCEDNAPLPAFRKPVKVPEIGGADKSAAEQRVRPQPMPYLSASDRAYAPPFPASGGAAARCVMLRLWWLLCVALLCACSRGPWNNPYPAADAQKNILYSSFEERPKHLDPVRAYSSNEYNFIAQIYEPPLQYHFLKRPYELICLTAEDLPAARYLSADGTQLAADAAVEQIAYSEYEIRIRPGIRYQPHPAFARDAQGAYLYHELKPEQVERLHVLADFPQSGTRELNAADYVYQIKRLAVPYLHSPIAGVMRDYIVGFTEFATQIGERDAELRAASGEQRPFLDLRLYPMEGVEVLDRYRYRIRLKGKYPQFLYWLAMPFFAPMPWEAERFYSQPGLMERNITLDWYPIGTGAFVLAENNPNLRMVLERNPNFHGERYPRDGMPEDREEGLLADAGRALPFIDKAIYSLEKESIPYWNKFLQGYYDTSGVSSDSFDQAVKFNDQGEAGLTDAMRAKGIRLHSAVTASVYYLGFNMLDPVVGGSSERARLLRRAISIAVDYEEFISIFANGRGVPAQSPLPPGIFGERPGDVNPYVYERVDGKPRRRSIEQARRLLAEAGYPGGTDADTGKPLVLNFDVYAVGPDDKARLNWWRKQLDKLGIQLVIRASDYNRFQEKIRKGTAQLFTWGWNADYPDPENFFFLLYGPNAKVEREGENASNYRNPEFDSLFEQMKNMDNGPERQAIIDRMVELLRWDAPWLWGFHPKAFSLYHSWYHNVKPNLMANNTLKYKRLDPLLRQRKRSAWNPPVVWPVVVVLLVLVASSIPAFVAFRRRERRAAQ
jgi:ABC-type transport system substrate-binding protein